MPSSSDPAYWDSVAAQDDGLPAGWRHHGRRVHLELVERWVGPPRGRWLKTDLYEERTPDRALLGHLTTARWVGMDVSVETARQAREAGPALVTDARRCGLAGGSFDGILSTSTLDHFDDPADLRLALAELARLLVPGGRLVLTLDNRRNPLIRARNALPRSVARRTGLVPFAVGHTVDARGGSALLAEVGLRLLACEHLLHAPHVVGTRPARWRWYEERALPRIDRLAHTRIAPVSGHYVAFLAERP